MKNLFLIAISSLALLAGCSEEDTSKKYPDKKLTKEECYEYEKKHDVDLDCGNKNSSYVIPPTSTSSNSIKTCAFAKGTTGSSRGSSGTSSKPSQPKTQKQNTEVKKDC